MIREEAIKICTRDLEVMKSNKAMTDGIEALEQAISDMQKLEKIEKFIVNIMTMKN